MHRSEQVRDDRHDHDQHGNGLLGVGAEEQCDTRDDGQCRFWVVVNSVFTASLAHQFGQVLVNVGVALEMCAAVEVEDLAGEPGRLWRAQERHRRGDILRRPGAASAVFST